MKNLGIFTYKMLAFANLNEKPPLYFEYITKQFSYNIQQIFRSSRSKRKGVSSAMI